MAAVSSRCWIFQALPERYNLAEKLRSGRTETWVVSRFGREIAPGDVVYLWQARSEAAVFGWAIVNSPVFEPHLSEGTSSSVASRRSQRVEILYQARFDPPITRAEIRSHGRLAGLAILRNAQGTNFRVTPSEARALYELARTHGFKTPPEPPDEPQPTSPVAPSAAVDAESVERRVLTGGISADLVDPDQGIPKEEDDLKVSTYVAMIATAIARKDTKLPLSIGLFRELAGPTDEEEEAEDRKRREHLRTWLADEQGNVKELEAAKAAATTEVAKLRDELEVRERDRANSALTLLHATVQAVQADEQAAAKLKSAWDKLGLKGEADQARLLADAVTGTRADMTAIREAAGGGNSRSLMAAVVATGLVLVITGLAASGVLGQLLARVVTGTGLATVLAAAVTFATLTRRVADGVRAVADLANQIRQRTQTGENDQVRVALDQVRAAEAREQVLQAQLDQVVARAGELARELVELSPGQRLYAFIAERATSEDYRRQLGLIATIRRDFERLARLQEQWRNDKDGRSPRPIDRIVLYIDDLDRCTPRQVVEVLQAVHLLLALDLFVVIVGVDPRWLLHSLRDQYRSTLTAQPPGMWALAAHEGAAAETSHGRDDTVREDAERLMLSTPHDYLEKIFNVPFVLPAMTPQGFDTMIRRLSITKAAVGHRVVVGGERQAPDDHDIGRPPRIETPSVSSDGGTQVTPHVEEGSEIATVQHGDTVVPTPLTEPELQSLSALAPLGCSPRTPSCWARFSSHPRTPRKSSLAASATVPRRSRGGRSWAGFARATTASAGATTCATDYRSQIEWNGSFWWSMPGLRPRSSSCRTSRHLRNGHHTSRDSRFSSRRSRAERAAEPRQTSRTTCQGPVPLLALTKMAMTMWRKLAQSQFRLAHQLPIGLAHSPPSSLSSFTRRSLSGRYERFELITDRAPNG